MLIFAPIVTTSLTPTATSAAVAIDPAATTLEFNNTSDVTVFVRWATASPTAVVTDYPVLPGHCKVVRCESGNAFLAAITGAVAATAPFYVTSGNGA